MKVVPFSSLAQPLLIVELLEIPQIHIKIISMTRIRLSDKPIRNWPLHPHPAKTIGHNDLLLIVTYRRLSLLDKVVEIDNATALKIPPKLRRINKPAVWAQLKWCALHFVANEYGRADRCARRSNRRECAHTAQRYNLVSNLVAVKSPQWERHSSPKRIYVQQPIIDFNTGLPRNCRPILVKEDGPRRAICVSVLIQAILVHLPCHFLRLIILHQIHLLISDELKLDSKVNANKTCGMTLKNSLLLCSFTKQLFAKTVVRMHFFPFG